jgi:hypothetical protein
VHDDPGTVPDACNLLPLELATRVIPDAEAMSGQMHFRCNYWSAAHTMDPTIGLLVDSLHGIPWATYAAPFKDDDTATEISLGDGGYLLPLPGGTFVYWHRGDVTLSLMNTGPANVTQDDMVSVAREVDSNL